MTLNITTFKWMKRIHAGCIAMLILPVILLAGVYFFRNLLLAPHISRLIIDTFHDKSGMDIKIGSIDGNYFSNIKIHGLKSLKPMPEGPIVSIHARQIKIRYSLLDLKNGIDSFLSGISINIDGGDMRLDLTHETKKSQDTGSPTALAFPIPSVIIRDTSISIVDSSYSTTLKGISLNARKTAFSGNIMTVHLEVAELFMEHTLLKPVRLYIISDMTIAPEFLKVTSMSVNGAPVVKNAGFDLHALSDGKIGFDITANAFDGEIKANGQIAPNTLEAQWRINGLDVKKASAIFTAPGSNFSGLLSSEGNIRTRTDSLNEVEGRMAFNVKNPSYDDIHANLFDFDLVAQEGNLSFSHFDVNADQNRILLKNISLPLNTLLKGNTASLVREMSGIFSIHVEDLPALFKIARIDMPSSDIVSQNHTLLIEGSKDDRHIVISKGLLEAGSTSADMKRFDMILPESEKNLMESSIMANLVIRSPEPGIFNFLPGPVSLHGATTGDIKLEGTLNKPIGFIKVDARNLYLYKKHLDHVLINASADGDEILVNSLKISHDNDIMDVKGRLNLNSLCLEEAEAIFSVKAIDYYLDDIFPGSLNFSGNLSGTVRGNGPIAEPEIDAVLSFAGDISDRIKILESDINARYRADSILFDHVNASIPEGDISFSGQLMGLKTGMSMDLEIKDGMVSGKGISLSLAAPSHILFSKTDGSFVLDNLALKGDQGKIQAYGKMSPDNIFDFHFKLSDVTSEGWLEKLSYDRVSFSGLNLDLHFLGNTDDPFISVSGTVSKVTGENELFPFSGTIDLEVTRKNLFLKQVEFLSDGNHKISFKGNIPFDPFSGAPFLPGELSVYGQLDVPELASLTSFLPPEYQTNGSLNGELKISGTWDRPDGFLSVTGRNMSFPPFIQPSPEGPVSMDMNIIMNREKLYMQRMNIESPQLSLKAEGSLINPHLLTGLLNGAKYTETGNISLHGKILSPDISWISNEIHNIGRIAGTLSSEISLEGPLNKPDIKAIIKLSNGEFKSDPAIPSLREISMDCIITQNKASIQALKGEMGGAGFMISGDILFDDDGKSKADLKLTGNDLLFYRSEGVKLRGSANLKAKGLIETIDISGDIRLTDGRFVKNFDFLKSLRDVVKPGKVKTGIISIPAPLLKNASLNVTIGSENPFYINNNIAKGSLRPELFITGSGEIPVIHGKIYVDTTRIKLPAGHLTIDSGVIQFLERDPDRPVVDILGQSKMMGYEVTIHAEGPYDDPSITLTSIPPLPEEELVLLLLAGKPPSKPSDGQNSQKRNMNVAVYLGRGFLENWFASETVESDESIFERFDVVVGKEVSRSGNETIDAQFRMAYDVIRKDDILYLTAQRDEFDSFNTGIRIVFKFK